MAAEERACKSALRPEPRALRVCEIEHGLAPARLGTRFHYFGALDSTNNYARSLAERGAPEGEVVIAERQTDGRGRLGRRWVSPPYVNLYCSIILRPTLPPALAPQISLVAAVAVADAVANFVSLPPAIKWPNDILLGGKKLAGVLTEAALNSQRLEFAIVGIGVNLNFSRDSMPPEIRERATSLSEAAGTPVSREAFMRRLLQDLDRCYGIFEAEGFRAVAPLWDARFGLKQRRVRVEMTDGSVNGRVLGIDLDGALVIEHGGERHRIFAGDVIPLEES